MRLLLGVLVALLTGTAIALQSTLNGRAGAVIGAIRTGLAVNVMGGTVSLIAIIGLLLFARAGIIQPPFAAAEGELRRTLLTVLAAGVLGIVIISGVSYAVQGVGVAAGLAAVILAQLLVGLIIDSAGGGSMGPIPLDPRRLAGVVAMGIGVFLLLPKA
jgi:transporter family-2 protein